MKKLSFIALTLTLCCSVVTIYSCRKSKVEDTDQLLYDLAHQNTGFIWYKNFNSLLPKSSGSGHAQPFLKVRYNNIAATQLDSAGKVRINANFPQGSLIVKELHQDGGTLARYAILYKQTGNGYADARGWVWGYVNIDGSVVEPSVNRGAACVGCHSQTGSIDYMLMNKYFP
ncbi:MAG: hypothetical protein IPO27_14720 [Bacteroidetes bacterium]|nr:hypothetical protein [Bacteroidota bacterium]